MNGNWSVGFQGIRFKYQNSRILDNITLALGVSDFILLTGHNGAGKSTLLRIIAGLLKPQEALVEYQDSPVCWRRARQFLRQNICYLHQQPYLFQGTVFDNLAYGLRRKRLSRSEIRKTVHQALESMSLSHLCKRNSKELSGGEKQRIAIARSWVIKPKLMLLDEPFANMDKNSRTQCFQLINALHQDNIGILITSHEPQHGELDFNRHLHLYQGTMQIKSAGSRQSLQHGLVIQGNDDMFVDLPVQPHLKKEIKVKL